MWKHTGIIALAVLVVAMLLTYTLTFQVDELKDIVLIETFGKVTSQYIGRDRQDAGLGLKWPWPIQRVVRYDSRNLVFDDTTEETLTRDKQNLIVTVYCAWRIAEPQRFHRSVKPRDPKEKVKDVQDKIRDLVRDAKKNAMSEYDMVAFVNTNPEEMHLEDIENAILGPVKKQAMKDYGVEIVRVGIKSLGLPEEVTNDVINAMKQERQRSVKQYESQGDAQAKAIEERARSASEQILAFAERKAKQIRTEGDQAAAKYYKRFAEAPEFSMFLRTLESLKKELSGSTQILLDPHQLHALGWFANGPSLPSAPTLQKPKTQEKAASR